MRERIEEAVLLPILALAIAAFSTVYSTAFTAYAAAAGTAKLGYLTAMAVSGSFVLAAVALACAVVILWGIAVRDRLAAERHAVETRAALDRMSDLTVRG